MDSDQLVPYLGAVGCVLLVIVAAAPFAVIDGQSELLSSYYASGPLGLTGVIFLGVLGAVIFLSSVRGRADAALVAGIMLVVGLTTFLLTALWAVSIESTVLFSFPPEYSLLEYHPWVTLGVSGLVAAASGAYAAAVY